MKTSLTTFEDRIREWLLELLHCQWRALGVPFIAAQSLHSNEIIDPEALLWCSLEFFPTQPRFCEQVLNWLANNEQSLLRPRIRKFAQTQRDPRASIWQALDPQWKTDRARPTTPCYGQQSVQELLDFCGDVERKAHVPKSQRHQTGEPEWTPATAILRARDVLGSDARHLFLVYLLANRGGAKLRSVAAWSGQSYRNISKIAQHWEAGHIISLEHGYVRLKNPAPWTTILSVEYGNIVLLNWWRLFDACIRLLRSLSKASAKSIQATGPVVAGLVRQAETEAAASVEGDAATPSETLENLAKLLKSSPKNTDV